MDGQQISDWLTGLVVRTGPAAPLLLFGAAFVEYVFPPFPGDLMVVLGSWYATHGTLSWPFTFGMVTLGSLAGATSDWAFGRWLGRRIEGRAEAGRGRLGRDRVERFERSYRRWGGLLLVANRFLPGIRALFFVAAGAARIPLWEVLLFGGISAALWNALLLLGGAFVARNLEELVDLFHRTTAAATLALVAVALVIAVVLWRRARRKG